MIGSALFNEATALVPARTFPSYSVEAAQLPETTGDLGVCPG